MRMIVTALMLAVAAGCQQTTAAGGGTGAATRATAEVKAPAADMGGVITWYTHDGAEKLYRQGKYADAQAMCEQAIVQIEKARGKDAPELAEPLIDLATVYLRLAKFKEAKAVIDRADGVLQTDVPWQALMVGRLGINKGWRLYSLGETETAEKVFRNARALVEKYQPGDSKDLAELINNQALMQEEIATEAEDEAASAAARRMLLQAWQMRRKVSGDVSAEAGESLNNLGMNLLFNAEKPADAELAVSTLKKSLEVSLQVYGEQNPETAMSRTNVAMAALLSGDTPGAEKELKIAMPITVQYFGKVHPDRAYQLSLWGRVLQAQNHLDEAEQAYLEGVTINEAVYGKNHPNVAHALEYLAHLYEAKGDEAKQREVQKRIEKLSGEGL